MQGTAGTVEKGGHEVASSFGSCYSSTNLVSSSSTCSVQSGLTTASERTGEYDDDDDDEGDWENTSSQKQPDLLEIERKMRGLGQWGS